MQIEDRILVTRSSMPMFDEYIDEIASLWDTHWLTNMGIKHQEFERLLKQYLEVSNIVLYTNGHSALECAFEALQLGADGRNKVITTPYTFASTTHAIVRKGLQPVFADIRYDDYTIDPARVEELIDDETCAIVPVHVYGNLCDDEAISDIAQRYNLKTVYDAAHAFGVKADNSPIAALGDISMFSFHATKVFNTIEGGALTFNNPDLKPILDQWKNFGITGTETVEYIGGNSKMNEFCAAMGICNLRHIEEEIGKRKRIAETYWSLLGDVEGIKLCRPKAGISSNYAYMPVVFEDSFGVSRDDVFESLLAEDIVARKYFYPLTTDFDCYKGRFDSSATPVAQDIASRVLTLPMYADLSEDDVYRIANIVRRCQHR